MDSLREKGLYRNFQRSTVPPDITWISQIRSVRTQMPGSHGLFPSRSLIQSPHNVRKSPCANRAGWCLENSMRASWRTDDISINVAGVKLKDYKHLRVNKMNHLYNDTNKNVEPEG